MLAHPFTSLVTGNATDPLKPISSSLRKEIKAAVTQGVVMCNKENAILRMFCTGSARRAENSEDCLLPLFAQKNLRES